MPNAEVKFTAVGTVVSNAVGDIQNTANFDGDDFPSDPVPRELPDIKAEFHVVQRTYAPGDTLTYRYRLTNTSDFPAMGVEVQTEFTLSKGLQIIDTPVIERKKHIRAPSFDIFEVKAETDGGGVSQPGVFSKGNQDINTVIDLAANGGFVEYTISPRVDVYLFTKIDVDAYYHFAFLDKNKLSPSSPSISLGNHPGAVKLRAETVNPLPGVVTTTKMADKKAYGKEDEKIVYTMTATNTGTGNMTDVHLKDNIRAIISSKTGQRVFKSWRYTIIENNNDVSHLAKENTNLDFMTDFSGSSHTTVSVTVEAVLNSGIDEPVTNTFQAFSDGGTLLSESDVTTPVEKPEETKGKLIIVKTALTPQIQPGSIAEYELLVENPSDVAVNNFDVVDNYPAGFRYVEGSAKIQQDSVSASFELVPPAATSPSLVFKPLSLPAGDKLKIRYALKASIGIGYGQYKNVAYADDDQGDKISDDANAYVAITGDKLFDTTSIIGKVFEDHNGNGYQSDATSKNIKVQSPVPRTDYVKGSMQLIVGDSVSPNLVSDDCPLNKGVKIPALWGRSNMPHTHPKKATIRYQTHSSSVLPVSVMSGTGTNTQINPQGQVSRQPEGALKKGLSNENLKVTRNTYKNHNGYLNEIIIENIGLNDDGIPGIRLITPEGFKVETDEFGRFHIPDRWVLDNKGRNFVIKLDTDSLPTAMQVISENPKVLRITPNKLNKFNFSVQKETQLRD
jgi:uncharacterized repeat protein (TIGR01451 family)